MTCRGTRYHGGKYAIDAEGYIDIVCSTPDSDINTIEETCFEQRGCGGGGGYFWVLVFETDADSDNVVVRMVGLERISSSSSNDNNGNVDVDGNGNNVVGDLWRMFLTKDHRSKGWGSKLVQ